MEKNNVSVEEVNKDVDTFKALDALAHSDGGIIIIDSLKKDVVNSVESLISKYRVAPEIELRASIAKLHADLSLLRVLTRSEANKKLAQEELEKLLAE